MKKLMIATLALCAAASIVSAQSVTSQNVVGYSTASVLANDYTMLGINFQAIGGAPVAIQDYFKGGFIGGPGINDADNLIVWTLDAGYKTYYYGVFGDPSNPQWDNLWYDSTDNETFDTIPPGGACWLLRHGAATNITLAGEVKATPTTLSILANDYTMFSNPYPSDLAINGGINVASPTGGPGINDADNLIVWTVAAGYKTYYYGVFGDPSNPQWDNLWYDSTDNETSDVIPVNAGSWYLRKGAATTMSFSSPL